MTVTRHVLYRCGGVMLRMVIGVVIASVAMWLILSCVYHWSDRRIAGTAWFYLHDIRYWSDACAGLLWIGVIAFCWRLSVVGINRLAVAFCQSSKRNDPAANGDNTKDIKMTNDLSPGKKSPNWTQIGLGLFDFSGRAFAFGASGYVLYRNGVSFTTQGQSIARVWHWLFDPLGFIILHGPHCPFLKDVSVTRFLWLPLLLGAVVVILCYTEKYLNVSLYIKYAICKSWIVTYLVFTIVLAFFPVAASLFNWFADGFYRVPVTVFMASGTITWKIFVIPITLLFFIGLMVWSRRKRHIVQCQGDTDHA